MDGANQKQTGLLEIGVAGLEPEAVAAAVSRVEVYPGDVICIRFKGRLNIEAAKRMNDQVSPLFPRNKLLFFDEMATIDVLGAGEKPCTNEPGPTADD